MGRTLKKTLILEKSPNPKNLSLIYNPNYLVNDLHNSTTFCVTLDNLSQT
jgi:hypothetical protein